MSDDGSMAFSPDRDSVPYWRAAAEGRLEIQRCVDCGAWRWPARAICNRCHSFDARWEAPSGRGRIVSWIVAHQPFSAAPVGGGPFVVASVALEEQDDLVLLGNLIEGEPGADVRVRAVFPVADDGERRLQWVVDEGSATPPAMT